MEIGLLVLQNPCTTEENEHFGVKLSKFIHIGWNICLTIGYRLTENRPDLEGG